MKEETIVDPHSEHIEKVAFILKTVAHPLRLSVVDLLGRNEKLSVNEICEQLQTEQSLTSHHLNIMKMNGIITGKREGKNVYYQLKEKDVLKVINCLENCECNFQ
ncbi:metalloregulator ArsR/SmtB family transcription factor [Flammeovirgaceae bacterium SG7u.111]|nr:metalloregulator ArsR/SmtB family transcription factor [Flammeovirgaceae bacterium SG7u.132]WPO34068.1 metalloregulator ArsR/SmtB family transcription factor [Flammeovirgaceae bacterium SG7u.111]